MARCDLHVHSKHSDHPTEWFLQRLGASESYTEPEMIYKTAKRRGMDLVTITDHNSIDGAAALCRAHPDDCFMGVETTTYFPEDRCKVHILIYDFSESQFEEIQYLRENVYDLRDFLKANGLAHSVAHATYSFKGNRLSADHLEKLILLFDTFETINGGRNARTNDALAALIRGLTEIDIERLFARHRIEPFGRRSWIKRETGGSDDHAGLFIGKTYTDALADDTGAFVDALRSGKTTSGGRHHDHSAMAFAIYKIAYDFAVKRPGTMVNIPVSMITRLAFSNKRSNPIQTTFLQLIGRLPGQRNVVRRTFGELVEELRNIHFDEIDRKIDALYDKTSVLADSLLRNLIGSSERAIRKGDVGRLLKSVSSSLPLFFLSAPFLSTFSNMYVNRTLVDDVRKHLDAPPLQKKKRILWFTDTITDLNGVADSLREIAAAARDQGREIMIAASLTEADRAAGVPPNTLDLPLVASLPLPSYSNLTIRVPSVLQTLRVVSRFDPDEIFISSPSTVGLVGLLIAGLLKVRCVGIYHTDVTLQASRIIDDSTVTESIESYMKWFYGSCTEILVNTRKYMEVLGARGYDESKMKLFRRGIDTDLFAPVPGARERLSSEWGIPEGVRFLYAGRVSKDKNIELLLEAVRLVGEHAAHVQLVVVGDGPDLPEMRKRYAGDEHIHFTGRVPHNEMAVMYSGCDAFLFASETDTFGRVVVEAQACGTPAIVGAVGGPQELVVHGRTGWIVSRNTVDRWRSRVAEAASVVHDSPERYALVRAQARRHATERYSLSSMLHALFPPEAGSAAEARAPVPGATVAV